MELTAKPTAVPARPGHSPYPGFRSAPVHSHRPRCGGRAPTGRWAIAHGAVGVRPWDGGRRESQEQERKARAWKRESRA